jgi:uncharacterized repeat protein (TIGR04076 family)
MGRRGGTVVTKVKITVLQRLIHQDLIDAFMEPDVVTRPCPRFADGQEFIVEDHPGPEFCEAAWNDIYKAYLTLASGGSFAPWMNRDDTAVVCCSDGIRPVFFKLERVAG